VLRPSRLAAVAVAVLAVALAAFVARPSDTPRTLASTVPAAGSTVAQAPAEVELTFTAPVVAARSHVAVHDRSGSALQQGDPRVAEPDRLRQPVRGAVAGEVTVAYHVTFVDGAELAGTLRFTTRSGNPAGARAAGPAPHRHGVDPLSAILLAVDGIVALAVLVLLLRRPRRPRTTGG
jgi:methionine-rich copper-binding protein CopC